VHRRPPDWKRLRPFGTVHHCLTRHVCQVWSDLSLGHGPRPGFGSCDQERAPTATRTDGPSAGADQSSGDAGLCFPETIIPAGLTRSQLHEQNLAYRCLLAHHCPLAFHWQCIDALGGCRHHSRLIATWAQALAVGPLDRCLPCRLRYRAERKKGSKSRHA
jgi:hypothetical protein